MKRLTWINFSATWLVLLLQRTPAVRVAAEVAEFATPSRIVALLRSMAGIGASLGAVHSLAGATTLVTNTPSPMQAKVGTPVTNTAFNVAGTQGPAGSWTIGGNVPPGLNISGVTSGIINVSTLVLSGTPTSQGNYTITLRAWENSGGKGNSSPLFSYVVNVAAGSVAIAPTINSQPASASVNVGGNASFSVSATGTPAPTYQWRKDGADLTGQTNATLSLTNVQSTNAGNYTVVVSNAGGIVTSAIATLTVTTPAIAPAFSTQPSNQTAVAGTSVTFTALASGSPNPSYQWRKDGNALLGQTSTALTLTNVQSSDAGSYSVVASNSGGSVTSAAATLTVTGAPTGAVAITTHPSAQTVVTGSTAVLSVSATNATGYQWKLNGANLAGATTATLVINSASAANAGSYSVAVAGVGGPLTSNAAPLSVTAATNFGHLSNLSINTNLASGGNFTMGYVVGGGAGNRPLLIRAVGPGLAAFGVPGTLPDPKLDLYSGSTLSGGNDNWGGGASLADAFASVGAFSLGATSKDAAAQINVANPSPANTTVVVSGASGSGLVLAEIYDLGASFNGTTPRLINVSVNKGMAAGETLIAGFVIAGDTSRTVLIRAVGPGLGAFGVPGTMADPSLSLYSGSTKIAGNDNWGGDAQVSAAFTRVGAFGLDAASKDAVLLVTLAPGAYTAQVNGTAAGLALVEVYEVP
jgi:hypothetical protein